MEKKNNAKEIKYVYTIIYHKFISKESDQPICISCNTRTELNKFFNLKQLNHLNNKQIIYTYLQIYNKAINEIYDPLDTLYLTMIQYD